MSRKTEPWYIHAVLYVIIFVLVYVLIQVAIVQPAEVIERDRYYKAETRLRMSNIREAEILWEKKNGNFSDDLRKLIEFIKTDSTVASVVAGFDTITQRSTNPFKKLSHGAFSPESLYFAPKSRTPFIVKVDTSMVVDTFINRRGVIIKIDSTTTIGKRYVIESPDSKDKISDLFSDALKNTASWE
ncbi:MAG: hypothetical protein KJ799_07065 [Bacteroidetes bacterium]|nr:hypothetical protein [Bacteroidota bacterium]MBU1680808.1 hypothetical protein [Bacteroidota bacterium]MBU2506467.1 hypothetical protein [Bacteroidota bacterium]